MTFFIFVSFRKIVILLLYRNKTVFERLQKDMAIESLVLQIKLMTLLMAYVKICAREKVRVCCIKATGIDMQNDTVARVKQYTGFELTYCESGDVIHFFYFSQFSFSHLARKSRYQNIIHTKKEKKFFH